MKEQSFDRFSLSQNIKHSDFYKHTNLDNEQVFQNVIEESYQLAHGLTPPTIRNTTSKGKDVYYIDELSYKLILRKLQSNIRNKIESKKTQRNEIVRNLVSYIQEGVKSKIILIDLKSFYESINIDSLLIQTGKINALSYHTKKLIEIVLEEHRRLGGKGVPRGIEFSSLLADLYLQEFDDFLEQIDGVFLYKRFVDDILIMIDHQVDDQEILSLIKKQLPQNLMLNNLKTQVVKINKRGTSQNDVKGKIAANFDYLGYKIQVIDTHIPPGPGNVSSQGKADSIYRKVVIGISDKKIKKIQTKLCKAFYNYELNRDFKLLLDRVVFLSTNRHLINKDKKRNMPTGIFYNYPLVNDNNHSLKIIDSYVRSLILGSNCRLSRMLDNSLSKWQVKDLLKISFSRGFSYKIHKKYSLNRLREITRIWK